MDPDLYVLLGVKEETSLDGLRYALRRQIKKLSKQLQEINIKLILKDKSKNQVKDQTFKEFIIDSRIINPSSLPSIFLHARSG